MSKLLKNLKRKKVVNGLLYFDVAVKFAGRPIHTETYSISEKEFVFAKDLGYFDESKKVVRYYDWKPIGDGLKEKGYNVKKDFTGGIKAVNLYTSDNEYVYAHTDEQIYSIKKYLFDNIEHDKSFILVGKREK